MHETAAERKPFVMDQADLIPGISLADASRIRTLENSRDQLVRQRQLIQDNIQEIENQLNRIRGYNGRK